MDADGAEDEVAEAELALPSLDVFCVVLLTVVLVAPDAAVVFVVVPLVVVELGADVALDVSPLPVPSVEGLPP